MRRSEDGLLLRKKQEQWAKEKEEEADTWFPFGTKSPGGGNPNKKHVARDYESVALKAPQPYARPAAENVPPPQDPSTSGRLDTVAARVASFEETGNNMSASYSGAPSAPLPYLPHHHPMMYATATGAAGGGMQPMDYMQQFHYAPMPTAYHPAYHGYLNGGVPEGAASAPGYAPYPTSHHHHYTPHMIPVHVLPAGTIPIPVPPPPPPQNTMTSSYSTEQWVGEWTNPHHKMMSSGGTTIEELSEDASSTVEGAVLPVERHAHITTTAVCTMQQPQQQRPYTPPPFPAAAAASAALQLQPQSLYDLPHAYVSPFVAAAGGGGGGSAQQTASDEKSENEYDGYKAQILERQRLETEREERERREEERIEGERREMEGKRRREEEKKEEEERKKEEDRQRSAQAVLEAMERAKKEAELLKKMRLHRHTLDAVAGAFDGVDRGRVEEIKKEVDLLERHKRLEAEEIARNAPPKEKKRGMSLSRSPSISAHYEADERPRSRAGPAAPATPATPPASPFRRAASLAPASAAARRTQQAASAAAASSRQPLATSTPQQQQQQRQQLPQPFERDAKMRFSLRGTPSPVGITSRYAHLNQPQSPSSRGSSPSTMTTPVRSPSVGRPPAGPPSRSRTQMNCTPSMPSRDSPLSRTFHAGDKTRQSMKDNARSSGYGIGGNFLYSYSPSASRSATPDRMGWSSSCRTDATPEPHQQQQQRRGREEERRREWREGSCEDGGSSPRSNDTYITSPTVTATSRVEEPVIRYSAPRDEYDRLEEEYGITPREEYGRREEEYGITRDYGRPRSSSVRPASTQEEKDEYGRRSNIPVPLPRTRFTPPSPANSSVTNPLFSPISTRARKMRISSKDTPTYRRENSMESSVTSNDSGASSGSEERGGERGQGGTKEGIRNITAKERVVPAIKVNNSEEETDEAPIKMFTPRFSSRPSTPDRVNGGLRHYSERVREMGTANADRLREPLTPQVQPRQSSLEPSSSLSASLRNLRMSINNLNMAGLGAEPSSPDASSGRGPAPSGGAASVGASPLLAAASDSPGLTRFHSRTSQYRSFNTKRGTERQQQLLDRLVSLRSRLQDTQSYKDRPLSRQGSTLSISGAGVSRLAASP